jgi:2-C-methyl-D-erythritol 4-phosphate cytidylyltransferase
MARPVVVPMTRFWAVVPAAGIGSRMGSAVPKQYLPLHGRPVIEHTLDRLCRHPRIAGVLVAVASADPYWDGLRLGDYPPPRRVLGGPERCHSVLNALQVLAETADAEDWVLVHDAARPCLRRTDIDRLMDALEDDPVGGLLGAPVRDTMKRADPGGAVRETVSREGLWHALTPQMFRLRSLTVALEAALLGGRLVTDEAQAMELWGATPRVIEGRADNIKLTRPEDISLAELYLRQQEIER